MPLVRYMGCGVGGDWGGGCEMCGVCVGGHVCVVSVLCWLDGGMGICTQAVAFDNSLKGPFASRMFPSPPTPSTFSISFPGFR